MRHLRNTIAWIAVPSVIWVALALVITDDYTATNLLLANKFLGPDDSMTAGRLWFVEVLVWILVALAVVCLAAPRRPAGATMAVRLRGRRSWSFGLALRYDVLGSALRPRRVVHGAGVLVLRDRLGRGEGVDGVAAGCW